MYPEAEQEHLSLEIGTGKIFHKRTLIAQRRHGETETKTIDAEILKSLPEFTPEKLTEAKARAEEPREAKRKSK